MLIETDLAVIAAFLDRKKTQGQSAMATLPGVSMIVSGDRASQIAIAISTETIAEAVIIGQLPHVHIKATGSPRNPVRRDAPNDQKPIEKRSIDLTDSQVSAVVASWAKGQSALAHEFIVAVHDRHGRLQIR